METVTLSSRFGVTIPKRIREFAGIEAGQRLQVLVYEGRIELIPIRDPRDLRGFVQGIDTSVERERA